MRIGQEHPGEVARSWEALGEARPGQSSLSAGALRYRLCDASAFLWHGGTPSDGEKVEYYAVGTPSDGEKVEYYAVGSACYVME